jgi:ferredoxin-NADP reductase
MSEINRFKLRVQAIRYEADGVLSVELSPLNGESLPPVEPGAHIDLHLDEGLVRSYSLVTPRCTSTRYVVAVLLDRASRGGSIHIHRDLRVGTIMEVGAPRNHFVLDESAQQTVLIGGGIGITPIYSMYARLVALGKPVTLLYCGRSRKQMALQDDIAALGKPIEWHIDEEAGAPPDLKAFLSRFPADADFYCCGPTPMLNGFEATCEALGYNKVHIERFSAVAPPKSDTPSGAYEVVLKRSGQCFHIEPGQTMYDVFLANKVNVEFSCKEGICGACETKVLEGIPEHRDSVLSKAERASNKTMMVCVSGCQGERLVLDL